MNKLPPIAEKQLGVMTHPDIADSHQEAAYRLLKYKNNSSVALTDALFRTVALNARRTMAKRYSRMKTVNDVQIATNIDPASEMEMIEHQVLIREAVERLPLIYRDSIWAYYLTEQGIETKLGIETICRQTGLPEGTIKSRLKRGRSLLKELLIESLDEITP